MSTYNSYAYTNTSGVSSEIPPPPYGEQGLLLTPITVIDPTHPAYREQRLIEICERYSIGSEFLSSLKKLSGFDIVLLCDDSGSMQTLIDSRSNTCMISRWDELKMAVNIVVDIGSVFDRDGLDIYFLNRPKLSNVKTLQQVEHEFRRGPSGGSDIVKTMRQIIKDKNLKNLDKNLLILLFTDGLPTVNGNININDLYRVIDKRDNIDKVFVSIVMCTDDDSIVEQYDKKFDKKIRHVDVVDDYHTERAQIQRVQGSNYKFSYGDYVVKMMMGAIDPKMDKLDEKKVKRSCCVIC